MDAPAALYNLLWFVVGYLTCAFVVFGQQFIRQILKKKGGLSMGTASTAQLKGKGNDWYYCICAGGRTFETDHQETPAKAWAKAQELLAQVNEFNTLADAVQDTKR